jgi:hypothetical protein
MFKYFQVTGLAILASLALSTPVSAAPFVPTGVHNDVSYDTVVNDWGWSVVYRGDYSAFVSIDTIFAGVTPESYVMLAGIQDGSSTFDVLAAALSQDVRTQTSHNATHTANDVNWYYNAYSMGFAGPSDSISQFSADTTGWSERDRLSWHTSYSVGGAYQDPSQAPAALFGGWRSGSNTNLNDSTGWDRVVLVYSALPESSLAQLWSHL